MVEKSLDVLFIINGDDTIVPMVKDTTFLLLDWLNSEDKLFNLVQNDDIVIIDSYLALIEFYNKIYKRVKLAIYIDDNIRIDYPPGCIVNSTIYANKLEYPIKGNLWFLLGSDYCMLRQEFWVPINKKLNDKLKSVIITVGGDDIRDLTPKLMKFLNDNYPGLKQNIIIGKAFKNIDTIKAKCGENSNLIYYPNAEEIKQIMIKSDFAIIGAGQTSYELASIGTPSITITIADNQYQNAIAMEEKEINLNAGSWDDLELLNNLILKISMMESIVLRKKLIKNGKRLINPMGCRKIVEKLLNYLKIN